MGNGGWTFSHFSFNGNFLIETIFYFLITINF